MRPGDLIPIKTLDESQYSTSGNCSMKLIHRRRRLQVKKTGHATIRIRINHAACSHRHHGQRPPRWFLAAPHSKSSFIFHNPSLYVSNLAG
jgi:hypothetical protein